MRGIVTVQKMHEAGYKIQYAGSQENIKLWDTCCVLRKE